MLENNKLVYEPQKVDAAKSILIEMLHLLGAYRKQLILIGGWVPYILFPNGDPQHVGSMDVDILLNHNMIDESQYQSIGSLLSGGGYCRSTEQPFTYFRTMEIEGKEPFKVQVDLLAGEYAGTGRSRRTQRVQDIHPRKVRGGEIAFNNTQYVTIAGKLPNGANDVVNFQVVTPAAFILMKSIALHDRIKAKDAWDIYFCIIQYRYELETIAYSLKHLLDNKLSIDAINYLSEAFKTIDSLGPRMVADFEMSEGEEYDLIARDAFERINEVINIATGKKLPSQ